MWERLAGEVVVRLKALAAFAEDQNFVAHTGQLPTTCVILDLGGLESLLPPPWAPAYMCTHTHVHVSTRTHIYTEIHAHK